MLHWSKIGFALIFLLGCAMLVTGVLDLNGTISVYDPVWSIVIGCVAIAGGGGGFIGIECCAGQQEAPDDLGHEGNDELELREVENKANDQKVAVVIDQRPSIKSKVIEQIEELKKSGKLTLEEFENICIDPITQEELTPPLCTLSCGHTFNLQTISQWFETALEKARNDNRDVKISAEEFTCTCPLCREPFQKNKLREDVAVKAAIAAVVISPPSDLDIPPSLDVKEQKKVASPQAESVNTDSQQQLSNVDKVKTLRNLFQVATGLKPQLIRVVSSSDSNPTFEIAEKDFNEIKNSLEKIIYSSNVVSNGVRISISLDELQKLAGSVVDLKFPAPRH